MAATSTPRRTRGEWAGRPRRLTALFAVAAVVIGGLAVTAVVVHARSGHASHPAMPTVAGSAPSLSAGRGAPVPFVEQEAANAATNGVVLAANRNWDTLAGEAVGRSAVTLTGKGKYVEFTTSQPANSLDVRYSIPDRADGSAYTATLSVYVNGHKTRDLTLTNRFSWYYGAYPFTNTASSGNPHHFYDEAHELLGAEVPAGARVRLQVDAEDTAASYTIDLVDFEDAPPPRTQPPGSLSVSTFGADATVMRDSSTAFRQALAAGAAQGRAVWIPPGTFQVNKHVVVASNTTLTGAGEWHSVLTGDGIGIYGNTAPNPSTNVALSYFAIEGTVDVRDDAAQVNGIGGAMGGGSTISNLWIEHTKVGIWLDGPFDGLTIDHTRIDDTTADGINLHDGITNATVTDNFIRNTGDDGIAAWSENDADTDDVISFNTVEVPILANNIAIYGGADNQVTDDVVSDTQTQGGGIHLANRFNAVAMSGTTTVARDTALRTGVLDPNWHYGVGALWFWASDSPMAGAVRVSDVNLIDSSYEGIQFTGSSVTNVDLTDVAIAGAGTFALQLESHGSASFKNVVATNIGAPAGIYNCLFTGSSEQAFTVTNKGGDTGWDKTFCGAWPAPVRTYAYAPGAGPDSFAVGLASAVGSVPPGGSATTSVTSAVTTGSAQLLQLAATGLPAGVTASFDVDSLSAGGSRILTVTAGSSVAAGRYPIIVTATGAATSKSATYTLIVGRSGAGPLTVDHPALTFATQSEGTSSSAQVVHLKNTGATGVTVTSIATTGDFGQHNDCGTAIAAGQSCEVNVTMDPTGAGSRLGTLTVSGDAVPVVVPLKGTATASSNLALNTTPTASGSQDGYPPINATDGNTGSYWESTNHAFPQSITIDLGSAQSISRLVLTLPPDAAWTTRTQTITVLSSTDGKAYTSVLPSAAYTFDPATKNIVTVRLGSAPVHARYVRLTVAANTGWPAAQFSEIEVFP
jgi:F5/8 type C domain/Pectate lyase superfamily protein